MKFAILGTGFIFRTHLQAINRIEGNIVDVVNLANGENAWKEMLKNTDADCVVILTPNDLHFEMAKFSAEKGKMVLCEKPLVIKSEQARILINYPNIFTVLQLRYHPFVKKIKEEIKNQQKNKISMNIFFQRDKTYTKGWKGNKERSGSFLLNLGIHYFDLLLYLFGEAKKIKTEKIQEEIINGLLEAEAGGEIEGENYFCEWRMYLNKKNSEGIIKKREFIINGKSYNFSSKENLAEENLHFFVYKDLLNKKGITPKEALKSIELVEKLYQY